MKIVIPLSRRRRLQIKGPRLKIGIIYRDGLSFWFEGSFIWIRPSIQIVTIEDAPETYTDIPF